MLVHNTFLLCFLIEILDACLPTQNVDSVTTTTVTTTTTATEAPFPCTVCPKIYDTGCLGPGTGDWCATAADVGVSYTIGAVAAILGLSSNTCQTSFSCPLGTSSRIIFFGYEIVGPSLVFAYCDQQGTNAGVWYYGIPPLIPTKIKLASLTCVGILSG
ncbi:unnamed protein product [Caenorhabditis sp. 36 PRJEB53466]|nr:unnamed protein product [Caenorhabditis sp. 36 PRJEB53466]